MVDVQVTSPKPSSHATARLVERKDMGTDLSKWWLEPDINFNHKPGQYCTIGVNGVERPYSIVSAPDEPYVELFIELVPHGELTPLLWPLKVGAELTIRRRAKGVFVMNAELPNQLMVATVTGVAPYVSILRDYVRRGIRDHRFYVIDGASYQDELAYREELKSLAESQPDLIRYLPCVSRPNHERNAGWQGETKRANLLVEHYIEMFDLKADDTVCYACGNPGMIEDVKERLIPQGYKVIEERFWKD